MANCYHQLTNDQRAVEIYEKMLELKLITGKRENLIWLYMKIADCYFRMEKFEKSLLVTLEALRRQPRRPLDKAQVRSYLTNNYYELGRYREAVFEGEKTIELSRRFPNDNIFVRLLASVRGKDVFVVQPTCAPVNHNVMELLKDFERGEGLTLSFTGAGRHSHRQPLGQPGGRLPVQRQRPQKSHGQPDQGPPVFNLLPGRSS